MSAQEKLEPCPWYESDKEEHEKLYQSGMKILLLQARQSRMSEKWSVRCGCGAEGPFEDTESEAIAAWNRRASSPTVKALEEKVAGLAAALKEAREHFLTNLEHGQDSEDVRLAGVVGEALKDTAPILARVKDQAKADAYEEAANHVQSLDLPVGPTALMMLFRARAHGLRQEAQ